MNNRSVNHESSDNCPHSTVNSGCGCNNLSGFVIIISPTTGGQFSLMVRVTDTIDHLKKLISKKLKVSRERICLLYRDRQLTNGSLQENDLSHGSRLTLLPTVETGLTTQKPELSVMNALESLNEAQVNDFLSGKAPLNLTMRLGDHMMLIQLMLSTFSNQNQVTVGSSKTDKSTSTMHSSPVEEKRKEVSSDPARSSSSRLERILSSTRETSQQKEKCPMDRNLVQKNIETTPCAQVSSSSLPVMAKNLGGNLQSHSSVPSSSTSSTSSSSMLSRDTNSCAVSSKSSTDSVPLVKATRNLTQKLQKLSSEVMTSKKGLTVQKYKETSSNVMNFSKKPNAILENMEHHGRGIYSGTFSGTLNPTLQDRFGRPKRDVSTIIHILNDLLCAEPRSPCRPSCTCRQASSSSEKVAARVDEGSSVSVMETSDNSCDSSGKIPLISLGSSPLVVAEACGVNIQNKYNENQTTRSKMEQLKSIMEKRKEKRKEKRFLPYEKRFPSLNLILSTPVSHATSALRTTSSNDTLETEPSSIHSEPVIV